MTSLLRNAYLSLLAIDPFLHIQHVLHSRWLDAPMSGLTLACETWPLFIIGSAFLALSEARPRGSSRLGPWLRAALAIGIVLALANAVTYTLKHAIHTPRPLGVLEPSRVHVLLFPAREMGLPSGHCVRVAAIAAFVTGVRPGRFLVLWLFAFLAGVSRIYVGAHWTFDVLAGWTVGLFIGWLASFAVTRTRAPHAGSSPSLD